MPMLYIPLEIYCELGTDEFPAPYDTGNPTAASDIYAFAFACFEVMLPFHSLRYIECSLSYIKAVYRTLCYVGNRQEESFCQR